jgi:hypothetical protein
MRGIEQTCSRSQGVVPVAPGQVVTDIKVTAKRCKFSRSDLGAKQGKTWVVPSQCRVPGFDSGAPMFRSRRRCPLSVLLNSRNAAVPLACEINKLSGNLGSLIPGVGATAP